MVHCHDLTAHKNYLCNGSVSPCTHTEEYYIRTDSQTVYIQYQMSQTTSLVNPKLQKTPPRDLLHVPITWNTAQSTPRSTLRLRLYPQSCQCHNLRENSSAVSIARPLLFQVSNSSTLTGIRSYALAVFFGLILLTVYDWN